MPRMKRAPEPAVLKPTFRLGLKAGIAMGPGKAALLEAVDATGSILAAAQALGMSYRRAWLLVQSMNEHFREPLVEKSRGGSSRGGARLTDFGRRALEQYRGLERLAVAAIERPSVEFRKLLK